MIGIARFKSSLDGSHRPGEMVVERWTDTGSGRIKIEITMQQDGWDKDIKEGDVVEACVRKVETTTDFDPVEFAREQDALREKFKEDEFSKQHGDKPDA